MNLAGDLLSLAHTDITTWLRDSWVAIIANTMPPISTKYMLDTISRKLHAD